MVFLLPYHHHANLTFSFSVPGKEEGDWLILIWAHWELTLFLTPLLPETYRVEGWSGDMMDRGMVGQDLGGIGWGGRDLGHLPVNRRQTSFWGWEGLKSTGRDWELGGRMSFGTG